MCKSVFRGTLYIELNLQQIRIIIIVTLSVIAVEKYASSRNAHCLLQYIVLPAANRADGYLYLISALSMELRNRFWRRSVISYASFLSRLRVKLFVALHFVSCVGWVDIGGACERRGWGRGSVHLR